MILNKFYGMELQEKPCSHLWYEHSSFLILCEYSLFESQRKDVKISHHQTLFKPIIMRYDVIILIYKR